VFDAELLALAQAVIERCRRLRLKLAVAESCTGGLIGACLTAIPGSSDVVDRGFVVYSNEAKIELLGVPPELLATEGAVSEATALALAEGVLANSAADVALSCTGIAGPTGASPLKPIGRVHIASARRGFAPLHRQFDYGDIGRDRVRLASVRDALKLVIALIG
jgi:nicotinamide-nucleotide amidase